MAKDKGQLSDKEITEFIKKDIEWPLEKGILYCLGVNPKFYNWVEHGGNDFPLRIRLECKKAITRQEIYGVESKTGEIIVERDEFVEYLYRNHPNDVQKTYELWCDWKKESPHQKKKIISYSKKGDLSTTQEEMNILFRKFYLEAYKKDPESAHQRPRSIVKSEIARKIIKTNPAWAGSYELCRKIGDHYNPDIARQLLEEEKDASQRIPVK